MIEVITKIHDRFSIEFKMGFLADSKPQDNSFSVGMWIFVPEALDINPMTFSKTEFYRSVKSNIRLKTPSFKLSEIVNGKAHPLNSVTSASDDDYDYRLKLFCVVVKSAVRDALKEINECKDLECQKKLCQDAIKYGNYIIDVFYSLKTSTVHGHCGEYLCTRFLDMAFKIMRCGQCLDESEKLIRKIYNICNDEGYAQLEKDNPEHNALYLFRQNIIKKMIESELYLRAPQKKDGIIAQQVYFSLAAGVAMLFATGVGWAFQKTYGNLTWPLFIALIVSYMMKDRIKELGRYYFSSRMNGKSYDQKARISMGGRHIGWLKEAMDFILLEKVPEAVSYCRNFVHHFDTGNIQRESVIVYRKQVVLNRRKMDENQPYDYEGINDIVRIQMSPFLKKMDNPSQPAYILDDDGQMVTLQCERDYFLNIVMQYNYDSTTVYKRFRIMVNRDGIKRIEPIDCK